MREPLFFGVETSSMERFLEILEVLKGNGLLHCLAELRVRTEYDEEVYAYGVDGVLEWSRTSAYTTPDIASKAVVRGDGWQWEIESIEWIGATAGTFQFAGYCRIDDELKRVRLLWQLMW